MLTQSSSTKQNQEFALNLGLLEEEYARILTLLERQPNEVELGMFSAMWSEHCSYKNSKILLKRFPTTKKGDSNVGRVLIPASEENTGVVDIGEGWAICFKIESHNHPSAVEPFEGAATGVGGILRDIFTMGARPVLLTNSLRFGELDSPKTQKLFRGVVSGISAYGNCVGIPNVGGDTYFDACYEGNPLVNALCLGVLRHDEIQRGAAKGTGNPIYYVGALTGRDGMGGASFASRELTDSSSEDRPAVQKGDPFMEKLLMEACLEIIASPGLVVRIQDMGAAGLTCSLCETAARGNVGIEVELSKVPQREPGMTPFEILLSESQERMLVIAKQGREEELEAIFSKWDLQAVKIGAVTEGNNVIIKHNGSVVADLPAKALADEAPVYERESVRPKSLDSTQSWNSSSLEALGHEGLEVALLKLLCDPTLADKRWIWRQYDHMVLTNTVVEPGSSAGVVRLRLPNGHEKYLAIANDCNNRYCSLNPYKGGQIAILECMRNLVCSGAKPLAMTNNLNFGDPYNPEVYYQLEESIRGMAEACEYFDIPVIGGNVSLHNEHEGKAIDPTPVVSIIGIIEERSSIVDQKANDDNTVFMLLGGWPTELGASYYLKVIYNLKTGDAPNVDFEAEKALHSFMFDQIKQERIQSAVDIAEGGLLPTLSMLIFSKGLHGAHINLKEAEGIQPEALLYGESQGRIIIAVNPENVAEIQAEAQAANVPVNFLGTACPERELTVDLGEGELLSWDTQVLKKQWRLVIPKVMDTQK